ncbi:hypothetical protein ACFRAO_42770 [Streptomyces sp. NPDC056656]|uniref:hypothetical protein n=1 Tax=Streptomyces sp. NPDC056656 TaxID=3345895 RepID=UPI0036947F47
MPERTQSSETAVPQITGALTTQRPASIGHSRPRVEPITGGRLTSVAEPATSAAARRNGIVAAGAPGHVSAENGHGPEDNGRPAEKAKAPSRRKQVLLRLHPQLYDALARWAGEELRSTNAQIEFVLRAALADAGRQPGGQRPLPRSAPEPGLAPGNAVVRRRPLP